jgi:hypothetical protein
MGKFKLTLESFCKTLRKRDIAMQLGITIKEPEQYTLHDVLDTALKLQQKHENNEQTPSYLRVIRKCFKQAVNHKGSLHSLLSFVPNDSYGSVICGGFTIILGVS